MLILKAARGMLAVPAGAPVECPLLLVLVLGGYSRVSRHEPWCPQADGCDEQAIDYGYCHMPKEVKR